MTGRLFSRAKSSDAMIEAVAPSLRPAALPAVTRPCDAERRLQAGEVLQRGARTHRLVGGDQAPAGLAGLGVGAAHRDRHQVLLDLAVGVRLGGLLLRAHGVLVGALLGDVRVAVVQVLGGHAHEQGGLVDQLLADEARVRVDALAHGVAAHVLDTAGDDDVVRTEGDGAGDGGDGGQRAGAHAVDGVAGHGLRQTRRGCRRCGRGSGPGRRSAWSRRWRPRRSSRGRGPGCGAAAPGSPSRRGRRRGSRGRCPSGPPCRTGCGRRRRRRRP